MSAPFVVDRYLVCDEIGSGGMAKVHIGRVLGAGGFSRVVAIKRVIGESADDDLATMLIDEARLASRVRHANVVTALDVVRADGHLVFVMEYVHGPSLSWLARRVHAQGGRVPLAIAARIVVDVLAGLHAAHEARSERGRPLDLIHRDVSPQNVLVSEEGVARVADFGIAHAKGKLNQTEAGVIRGKLLYMAPEQLRGDDLDRRADIYAVGILFWELLTGKQLRAGASAGTPITKLIADFAANAIEPPSRFGECPAAVEHVVLTALASSRDDRWSSAQEMSEELERACPIATPKEVAAWLRSVAGELLANRARLVADVEAVSAAIDLRTATSTSSLTSPSRTGPPPPPPPIGVSLELAPTVAHVPVMETPRSGREASGARGTSLLTIAMLAVLGALVASGIGIVVIRSMYARPVAATVAPRGSAVDSPRASSSSPVPSPGPTEETPPSVSASTASTASPASPASPASLVASVSPSASVTPSASARTRAKHAARPDCNPPYTIDEQGVRVPKRECFAVK